MDSFWQPSKDVPVAVSTVKPENSAKFPSPPFQFLGGSASHKGLPAERHNATFQQLVNNNLLKVYNLDHFGSKFDRYDPVTREKVNKLRKSYIGKVRDKNIRFKAQAVDLWQDAMAPALFMPEDQWEHMHSLKLADAMYKLGGDPDTARRFERAVGSSAIAPGRLPDWKNWSTSLCLTEDQLRTDFERKRDLERERKLQASAGAADGSGVANRGGAGKLPVSGRPNGTTSKLPVQGKPVLKRRLGEPGGPGSLDSPRTVSSPVDSRSRIQSGANTPTVGTNPSTPFFPKKKKRIISRAGDGMRVGIAVDR